MILEEGTTYYYCKLCNGVTRNQWCIQCDSGNHLDIKYETPLKFTLQFRAEWKRDR